MKSQSKQPEIVCSNPDCKSTELILRTSKGPALVNHTCPECGGRFKLIGLIGETTDYECGNCGVSLHMAIQTYQCQSCKRSRENDLKVLRRKSGEVIPYSGQREEFRISDLERARDEGRY